MSDYIYPYPLLPYAASPQLYAMRQQELGNTAKVATSNLIIEQQDLSIDVMTQMTIEDFGALELINTAKHNLITGNNISYKPFSKLSVLNLKYDPMKILALSDATPAQFDAYALALENYVPELNHVYIDDSQNIVLEFINVQDNDFVEVEIISQGELYNDTIY
jgi:hypothetical protein